MVSRVVSITLDPYHLIPLPKTRPALTNMSLASELRTWYEHHRQNAAAMPSGGELEEKVNSLMGTWTMTPSRRHPYWLVKNTPHGIQFVQVIVSSDPEFDPVCVFSSEGHLPFSKACAKGYTWKKLHTGF